MISSLPIFAYRPLRGVSLLLALLAFACSERALDGRGVAPAA